MDLDYQQRRKSGAFYTPEHWARFCVDRIREVLPCLQQWTFYDPAAGEGALLDALPPGVERYGSTLEREDVYILKAKGYEAELFDFLQMNTHFLNENIRHASNEGDLVVLTNPPYFKIPSNRYTLMKRLYPAAKNDATALFLLRILTELKPAVIAAWTKMDIYQSTSMKAFREEFDPYGRVLTTPVMTPSMSWPGLKGKFPIVFSVFAGAWY